MDNRNAIAPYFASAYITLVSVVQGIVLAALVNRFFGSRRLSWVLSIEGIIVFIVIAVVWHRYVSHTQYIAWSLTPLDTVIPLFLCVLQYALISLMPVGYDAESRDILYFLFAMTSIWLSGIFAYWNARAHFKEDLVRTHFKYNKEIDADCLNSKILDFEDEAIREMALCTMLSIVVIIWALAKVNDEIILLLMLSICIYALCSDIRLYIRTECLKNKSCIKICWEKR